MHTAARRSDDRSQRRVLPSLVGHRRPKPEPALAVRGAKRRHRARALMMALALILGVMMASPVARAHAPALATATSEASLLAAPSPDATVLALLPAGTEVQLTGAADGAFLEVATQSQSGWVVAARLNGGIATASVLHDVSLYAAPNADGKVLGGVPAGSTVILTGAAVDGFVAASFAGTGGWLPASALAAG